MMNCGKADFIISNNITANNIKINNMKKSIWSILIWACLIFIIDNTQIMYIGIAIVLIGASIFIDDEYGVIKN